MKSSLRPVLMIAAISLVAVFGWSVRGEQKVSPKQVWEHKVVSSMGDNPVQLTRLGAEGWELVSVRPEETFIGNFKQVHVTYYLKRAR